MTSNGPPGKKAPQPSPDKPTANNASASTSTNNNGNQSPTQTPDLNLPTLSTVASSASDQDDDTTAPDPAWINLTRTSNWPSFFPDRVGFIIACQRAAFWNSLSPFQYYRALFHLLADSSQCQSVVAPGKVSTVINQCFTMMIVAASKYITCPFPSDALTNLPFIDAIKSALCYKVDTPALIVYCNKRTTVEYEQSIAEAFTICSTFDLSSLTWEQAQLFINIPQGRANDGILVTECVYTAAVNFITNYDKALHQNAPNLTVTRQNTDRDARAVSRGNSGSATSVTTLSATPLATTVTSRKRVLAAATTPSSKKRKTADQTLSQSQGTNQSSLDSEQALQAAQGITTIGMDMDENDQKNQDGQINTNLNRIPHRVDMAVVRPSAAVTYPLIDPNADARSNRWITKLGIEKVFAGPAVHGAMSTVPFDVLRLFNKQAISLAITKVVLPPFISRGDAVYDWEPILANLELFIYYILRFLQRIANLKLQHTQKQMAALQTEMHRFRMDAINILCFHHVTFNHFVFRYIYLLCFSLIYHFYNSNLMMLLHEDRRCTTAADITKVDTLYAMFLSNRCRSGLMCPNGHHLSCMLPFRTYPFHMAKPAEITQHELDVRAEHRLMCDLRYDGAKWVDNPPPPKPPASPAPPQRDSWMHDPPQDTQAHSMPAERVMSGGCNDCPSYPHTDDVRNLAPDPNQSSHQPFGSASQPQYQQQQQQRQDGSAQQQHYPSNHNQQQHYQPNHQPHYQPPPSQSAAARPSSSNPAARVSYAHPISTQAPQSVPLQPILRNPTDVAHTAPVAHVMSQYSPSNTQTNTGMASAELDTLMGMAEEKTMLIGNYPDEKSDQKEGPSLAVDHCVYSDALMNLQHNENSTLLTTLITTKADSNMLCLAAFGTARPLGSGDTNTLMMQLLNLSNQASALKIEAVKIVVNSSKAVSNDDKELTYLSRLYCQIICWPLPNTEPRRMCENLAWLAVHTECLTGGFMPWHTSYQRAMFILSKGIETVLIICEMTINHCSAIILNMASIVQRLAQIPPFSNKPDAFYLVTKHKLTALCVGHRYVIWRCMRVVRRLQHEQNSSEAVVIDQRYVIPWFLRACYFARRTNTRMDILLECTDWLHAQSHRQALGTYQLNPAWFVSNVGKLDEKDLTTTMLKALLKMPSSSPHNQHNQHNQPIASPPQRDVRQYQNYGAQHTQQRKKGSGRGNQPNNNRNGSHNRHQNDQRNGNQRDRNGNSYRNQRGQNQQIKTDAKHGDPPNTTRSDGKPNFAVWEQYFVDTATRNGSTYTTRKYCVRANIGVECYDAITSHRSCDYLHQCGFCNGPAHDGGYRGCSTFRSFN